MVESPLNDAARREDANPSTDIRASLEGATALVTGGTSGIGAEVASWLASARADVAVVGRDAARLASSRQRAIAAGTMVHSIQADLADETAYATIAERTRELFKHLDIVVHAAGLFLPGPFAATSLDDVRRTFAINVIAPFALTQALLPQLRAGSSIIFVSSVAGHVGLTREAAYSASKGAVEALTRALAMELAPRGIRVNAVAPGFTATPMNASFRANAAVVDDAVRATLAHRLGLPEDVAAAVLFLVSPEASFIWGTVLAIDGGYPTSSVQLERDW
jgi:NAD(P)-dependent dehydrogenase (short-subunit alcohol dehydrogenase family)